MKRFLGIMVWLLLVPAVGHAAAYGLFSYGIGGDVDEASYGFELGGVFLSDWHPAGGVFSLGLGISFADTDDDPPGTQALPGGTTLSGLREYNDGDEQSIGIVFGAELVPQVFGVLGVGYSQQNVVTVGSSGGVFYEADEETDGNVPVLLGVRYLREGLALGIGYETRRGILATIGIAF